MSRPPHQPITYNHPPTTPVQALMWSLGKVVNTPEVCRVYIGSFWEHPLANTQNRFLLEREKQDLLSELDGLPQNAVVRRINELVKRARSVKVHAYLIHYLRKQVRRVDLGMDGCVLLA